MVGGRCVRQSEVVTVAARLTDRQKKKILADYVQTNNYCATAKLNGVSANTVKKIVQTNADIAEKLIRKKEENTADVLTYMESQRDMVCQIIGKGLAVLNDPAKLAEATPSQITTAIGTLIDKWTLLQEKTANDDSERVRVIIDV
uniref:InsA C-terminal domain n=1 Tax=Siphoviridae sp. ctLsx2 TaxID=2826254 RepID=A0A8S5QSZ1_9CAUD|nr:MAG TPA: InsA C-terminal domain [Siphoviridae sp. ctLsx2]DAS33459.1 MAG TPA: InsA C-terminal domain [Caudoviricetes sp.]